MQKTVYASIGSCFSLRFRSFRNLLLSFGLSFFRSIFLKMETHEKGTKTCLFCFVIQSAFIPSSRCLLVSFCLDRKCGRSQRELFLYGVLARRLLLFSHCDSCLPAAAAAAEKWKIAITILVERVSQKMREIIYSVWEMATMQSAFNRERAGIGEEDANSAFSIFTVNIEPIKQKIATRSCSCRRPNRKQPIESRFCRYLKFFEC